MAPRGPINATHNPRQNRANVHNNVMRARMINREKANFKPQPKTKWVVKSKS